MRNSKQRENAKLKVNSVLDNFVEELVKHLSFID